MGNTCVVGLQWGDEAKGKKVDILAPEHSFSLRYNGGSNAGHTVVRNPGEEPYKLNLMPSGILSGIPCALADQVAIYPQGLIAEIERLQKRGVVVIPDNFFISDGANLTTRFQIEYDGATGGKIGTTKKGIGPTFSDRAFRRGLIVHDLNDIGKLEERVNELYEYYKLNLAPLSLPEKSAVVEELLEAREKLLPYVTENIQGLVLKHDGNLLFEAAQGALLGLYTGSYRDVSASDTTSGGIAASCGVNVHLERIIGVLKAYITRVGGGFLPTEQDNEFGKLLQSRGHEVGTTTGRTRRCGWFDAVASKYGAIVNGVTELDVTKLDVLDAFKEIPICLGYEVNGRKLDYFPRFELGSCKPIYEVMDGWEKDTTKVRRYQDLPVNARKYVGRIEQLLGVTVGSVGVGPEREATIFR